MRIRLTDALLDRARISGKRPQAYLFDTELPGFGVVLGSRVQTFIVNYRDRGVKKRRALGQRSPSFGVEQARAAARVVLGTRTGSNHVRLRQAEQRLLYAVRDWLEALVLVECSEHELAALKRKRRNEPARVATVATDAGAARENWQPCANESRETRNPRR